MGLGSLEQLFLLTRVNELLSGGEVFNIARGIALGLEYLHSLQIIHADVKLANILLSTALQAKIADFGLAHVAPNGCLRDASVTHFTQSQMIAANEKSKSKIFIQLLNIWF